MKRGKTYFFDVDGTLTPPTKSMTVEAAISFLLWCAHKPYYIVAGSDKNKVQDQLPSGVFTKARGVFCCMGNELWIKDNLIYRNEWEPPAQLLQDLTEIHLNSIYKNKNKNHIDIRTGMLNFSTLGRDSSLKERKKYFQWDKVNHERSQIVQLLKPEYPYLDFVIGGEISIDIQPVGADKGQAIDWVRKRTRDRLVYFGDKCSRGGNDFSAATKIHWGNYGKYYQVSGPEETMDILLSNES